MSEKSAFFVQYIVDVFGCLSLVDEVRHLVQPHAIIFTFEVHGKVITYGRIFVVIFDQFVESFDLFPYPAFEEIFLDEIHLSIFGM